MDFIAMLAFAAAINYAMYRLGRRAERDAIARGDQKSIRKIAPYAVSCDQCDWWFRSTDYVEALTQREQHDRDRHWTGRFEA